MSWIRRRHAIDTAMKRIPGNATRAGRKRIRSVVSTRNSNAWRMLGRIVVKLVGVLLSPFFDFRGMKIKGR